MAAGMMAGFMGGQGSSNSLDLGSGVGDSKEQSSTTWGDWGGDVTFGNPPSKGLGFDLSNPEHMVLAVSGLLIVGAVLIKRAR